LLHFFLAKDDSDETDSSDKKPRDKSRDRDRSRDRSDRKDRERDRTPPRGEDRNGAGWPAASPQPPQTPVEPNQEVENMNAKMERFKVGRKFKRRLSEL